MPSRSGPKQGKRSAKRGGRPKPPSVPRPLPAPVPGPVSAPGSTAPSAVGQARTVADWPVFEALVNEEWDDVMGLATVVIARRHPRYASLVIGGFVVDLKCLGVKNTIYARARDEVTYQRRTRLDLLSGFPPMMPIAPALAAKIVTEGVAYAEGLGFSPHHDFAAARVVLDGLDPSDDPTPVAVGGEDGRPHFVSGPFDDSTAIIAHLKERLGDDGFHATVLLGDPFDDGFFDDDLLSDLLFEGASIDDLPPVHPLDDDEADDALDDDLLAEGFVPFFVRCPEIAVDELSHVTVQGLKGVADGGHPVIESYCIDPTCDCRRVFLNVIPDPLRPPEATISFSWADDDHLRRWSGNPRASAQTLAKLRGPILEPFAFQGLSAKALLGLVKEQLLADPAFVQRLELHYAMFRATPPHERDAAPQETVPLLRRLFGR